MASEVLETIERNASKLREVIESVTAAISADAPSSAEPTWCRLEPVLKGVVHTHHPDAEILIDPDLTANIDEAVLGRVLGRILENAVRFAPGPLSVEARLTTDELLISIIDRGPGVPVTERARVFNNFTQLDPSATRQKGGTGTGLYLARQEISSHGGRVWVEETPGGGATFLVAVPQRQQVPPGT